MALAADKVAHLEQLIAIVRRRQRLLETQRAGYGPLAVPAHIALELEDIARDLARDEAELRRLRPNAPRDSNPYLGLLTFQETDAARFFGRDTLVAALVKRARRAPFLAVLGASGSGKSSLVRAGLIPQLKAGALEGSESWRYLVFKPGARPLDALAAELAKLKDGVDLDLALRLSRSLAESDHTLLLAADILLDRANGQRLVLLVDQFEELWTQAPAEQRDRFVPLLLATLAAPDTPFLLIVTMRADFLHRAIEYQPLAEQIEHHVALVSPMQPNELRDAITRPAESLGGFEPGLVEELVTQVQGRPGALPLLEYTLLELWKRREPDDTMTWAEYRALGGVEGALAARADQILTEHYTADQQVELRQLLLRLVQPGEGAADTRRRARLNDLVPAGESLYAVQLLLKPLTDERLLTTGRDSASGEETVEVSHEALIRAWPTFGRWISEARSDLRFQIQLSEAASEWDSAERNVDLLWSGLRLAQANAWLERTHTRLNARDQAFLETSRADERERREAEEDARRERERLLEQRAEAERRNVSRLRVFLVIGAALLVVAIGAAMYALNQSNRANDFAAQSARNADLSATSEAKAQANATQSEKDRNAAEEQARIANAQANAGESLFELGRGNADRALLLARASIATDTPRLSVRALRETIQRTVPSKRLVGHENYVTVVAWSPDSTQLATASTDDTARVWDATNGRQLATLKGHTSSVSAVAWSPNGKQLATASDDTTARMWDAATGKQLAALEGHTDIVFAVAWNPDGTKLATASDDTTARVWDAAAGKQLASLEGHTSSVSAVAWSPDGTKLATASGDTTARVWDAATGKQLASLEGHTSSVSAVAWSPNGTKLATASDDTTARVWDAATGKQLASLEGHTGRVNAVVWNPDGRELATTSYDKTARVWDTASGMLIAALEGHTGRVNAVAWSSDGRQIVTASNDTTAKIWDVTSGTSVSTFTSHLDSVTAVAWSPDGTQLVTGSDDTTAKTWNMVSGVSVDTLTGHSDSVWAVAWSPDGKQLVTGSWDKTARVWDVETGTSVAILAGHTGTVWAVAWSPDGKQIVTGSVDNTGRVWDVASGTSVTALVGHTDWLNAVAWSPDGTQLATGSDDSTAKIWDVVSGKAVATLAGHSDNVVAVAWSPDGTQLVTGSGDSTAKIWDVISGKAVATLIGHTNWINAVVWSPDGQRLATASADGTARVWDAATGEQLATLEGHTSSTYAVVWSPNGTQLATASNDNTARVWDAATGKQLAALEDHMDRVNGVAWSPNGKQLATASDDKTAKVWIADNNVIIAELTRRVCNIFTDDQITMEIPAWRGCTAELAAINDDLAEYDRLRPRR